MCKRHSFLLTSDGKVLDGMGLTHSHTEIAVLHGIESKRHDDMNAYEWQPPTGWPDAMWLDGLTVDRQNFEPKASHDKALKFYLKSRFPDMTAWDAPETPDPSLDGKVVTLGGREVGIILTDRERIDAGVWNVCGSARIGYVCGSAHIDYVYGSARIGHVYGSAHIGSVCDSARIDSVYGSASIDYVYGSARIGSVYGSASIDYVYGSARIGHVYGSASIDYVYGSARIGHVYGSASIDYVYGSARIGSVCDSARIDSMYDSAHIGYVCGKSVTTLYGSNCVILGIGGSAVVIDRMTDTLGIYTADGER